MNASKLIENLTTLAERGATEGERDAATRALARVRARMEQETSERDQYRFKYEGSKYRETSNLSSLQIAALIRADIQVIRKAARKAGIHDAELALVDPIAALPKEAKIYVRREFSTWTSHIYITVKGLTGDRWWTYARGYEPKYGPGIEGRDHRHFATDATIKVGVALSQLANAYNYDDSDIMTDYFNQRFFLDVQAIPPGEKWPSNIDHARHGGVWRWIDEQPSPVV